MDTHASRVVSRRTLAEDAGQADTQDSQGGFSLTECSTTECITEQPLAAAGVTLLAGIGLGFCVGAWLCRSSYQKSYQSLASRIGNHVMNSVSDFSSDYFTKK